MMKTALKDQLATRALIVPILLCTILGMPAVREAAIILADTIPLFNRPLLMRQLDKEDFAANEEIMVVVENAYNSTVELDLVDSKGNTFTPQFREIVQDSQRIFRILPPAELRPGKYEVQASNGKSVAKQDFTWGVLAINANKSMYTPGEQAELAMAVLDERGSMVCDAEVRLDVRYNKQVFKSLSTGDGSIKVNPECRVKDVVDKPDYEAQLQLGEVGKYDLILTATTKKGQYSVADSLQVKSDPAFVVERTTATRIYPIKHYPVSIKVTANEDFKGDISEVVPESFDISNISGSAGGGEQGDEVASAGERQQLNGELLRRLGLPYQGSHVIYTEFGKAVKDGLQRQAYAASGLKGHDGIDFVMAEGSEVLATDEGNVVLAGEGDYGTTVIIEHVWGRSYYGQLQEVLVKKGQRVAKGQVVAKSGRSGIEAKTEAHLHFGIKPNYNQTDNGYMGKINPAPYLDLGVASEQYGVKLISWRVELKKGQTAVLGYTYDAPDRSPEFYTVGPLSLQQGGQTVYQESRLWQIASDAVIAYRSSNTGTSSVTKPSGVAEDDVLIGHACRDSDSSLSTPSGWTSVRSDVYSNDLRCSVFYKVATSSEPSSYSFSGAQAAGVAAYTGVDTTSPIHKSSGNSNDSTSASAPAVTTTIDDAMVLAFFGLDSDESLGTPSGMTRRWLLSNSNASSMMADQFQATAGSTGSKSSSVGSSENWVAQMVVLAPMDDATAEQADYRIFANTDSTDVGDAMAEENAAATLVKPGQAFRLRQLVHFDENDLDQDGASFKLQYAGKGTGTCAAPSGGFPAAYTDVGTNGDSWEAPMWESRARFSSTVYNGKIWVAGGYDYTSQYFNDVWSSGDGASWSKVTADAGWGSRSSHTMEVFNNKMWVFGGYGPGGYVTDIWSSSDGESWTQETADSGWGDRSYYQTAVFNDKLWMMGGSMIVGGTTYYNDVWSSSDGANWTRETANAGWASRDHFQLEVFNNKMWVIGGYDGSGYRNDVWSSSDGVNWSQVTGGANWSGRSSLGAGVYDSKLWVMGGYGGGSTLYNDVWWSSDGANWTRETANAGWSARDTLEVKTFANQLWVLSGADSMNTHHDVWSSSDGASWTRLDGLKWSHRVYHASVEFDGKMWVMGGYGQNNYKNDVWSSSDGVTWTQATASAGWSARNNLAAVVFDGKMWVMGGWNGVSLLNDVWSSSDGVTWTQATASAGWSVRSTHRTVAFDGKMWVMGGTGSSSVLNDVWWSTDGSSWTRATSSAGWNQRMYPSATVFDNKMWLSGGNGNSAGTDDFNDVWWSTDGSSWTRATSSAGWAARQSSTMLAFDNRLWVMGGKTEGGSNFNDVWVSSDGDSWTQQTGGASWHARYGHTSLVFDDKMWVIGGHDGTLQYNSVFYTTGTLIDWNNNASVANGANLTVNGADPSHSGHTIINQTYVERGLFTNSVAGLVAGQDGLWDFALKDNGAARETTYCLRIVRADGTPLDAYSQYAEITTAQDGPEVSQLLRHGQWFDSGGSRRPFTF